jgi:hypothetical protein
MSHSRGPSQGSRLSTSAAADVVFGELDSDQDFRWNMLRSDVCETALDLAHGWRGRQTF